MMAVDTIIDGRDTEHDSQKHLIVKSVPSGTNMVQVWIGGSTKITVRAVELKMAIENAQNHSRG